MGTAAAATHGQACKPASVQGLVEGQCVAHANRGLAGLVAGGIALHLLLVLDHHLPAHAD